MPIDTTLRDALSAVTTASLARALMRRGLGACVPRGLRRRTGGTRAVGAAVTMRLIPARDEAGPSLADAVEAVPEGAVVVIDAGGAGSALPFGAILAERLLRRGAAGLVVSGALPAGGSLPVWDCGEAPALAAPGLVLAGTNEPIGCAGAAVHPGDIVVGDGHGIVIVPPTIAEVVAFEAVEQQRLDLWILRAVENGGSLAGLLPPDEAALARFRAETETR
ncbi:dimethylmenaquinone methyltransferase [Methylobacterium durans]|uniref:RraA family protein n=1 Tax=Methylobacterium durans TaxID=2202825 RepID=UPI002AFE8ADA|nr:dimethylmenaquinone methyltransferase [Methylobacterium durans]MEA1831936.1 dimethylmenaquinone methyltransferase [Methylobacterium durans]